MVLLGVGQGQATSGGDLVLRFASEAFTRKVKQGCTAQQARSKANRTCLVFCSTLKDHGHAVLSTDKNRDLRANVAELTCRSRGMSVFRKGV
jgi:hypothetical protein